jgi:hypothetical protein
MLPKVSITITLTFDQDGKLLRATCPRCDLPLLIIVKISEPHDEPHDEMACLNSLALWHRGNCKKRRRWFR